MTRETRHLRGAVLAALGAACWSPDGLILHVVEADAWQALFWRMLTLALALTAVLGVREGRKLARAVGAMGAPGLATGFLLGAVNVFFHYSITHTAVANTLVIFATVPLFGALLGWFFLKERVPLRTIAALAIGLGSIAAIFAEKLAKGDPLGDLAALLAALFFAGNITVARRHPDVPLLPSIALGGLLGAGVGALVSDPFAVPARDILFLSASGSLQQTAAFFLFLSGSKWLPPAEAGLLALVETVLGPLWVWLALGEQPTAVALVAGSVVIAALIVHAWLGLAAERRHDVRSRSLG